MKDDTPKIVRKQLYIYHLLKVEEGLKRSRRRGAKVKRKCRPFEFEYFNSQISSFSVILAEQISINLQYMELES